MAPAAKRAKRGRRPLANSSTPTSISNVATSSPALIDIFDASQHVPTTDSALNQIKQLYKVTSFREFEKPFKECVEKLLHCKHNAYFKTSCEFVCKFLQHLSKLSDEIKTKERDNPSAENTVPQRRTSSRRSPAKKATPTKRGSKRKASVSSEDELIPTQNNAPSSSEEDDDEDELISVVVVDKRKSSIASQSSVVASQSQASITDHDRVISTFIEVVNHYMKVFDEECRLNAVFLICKFFTYVESLDEEICEVLKSTFVERIRDKKPNIRAQAVLASRIFQESKMIKDAFMFHFERDPELVVRKALLQIMDPKIFGYDFLVNSTRDIHDQIRKVAFQRLGKIEPNELKTSQIHQVIQNGLNERNRQVCLVFKTCTSTPWLKSLYDGTDLLKLLRNFDVLNNDQDVCRLLEVIYENNQGELLNDGDGDTTQLHRVVENFRDSCLNTNNQCLPLIEDIDENVVTVWMTLIKFCKKHENIIKSVKISPTQEQANEKANESIEEIIDSQEVNDEVVELHERLTPDLVNLIDFLRRFVQHSRLVVENDESQAQRFEFIYSKLMAFISTYDVVDEVERQSVQEVLEDLLKESYLTGKFNNFIPPVVECLYKLIYSSSSNLLINYISEMISNIQSHLEDLVSSTAQPQLEVLSISTIPGPRKSPRIVKKVRVEEPVARSSRAFDSDEQNLEMRMATIRFNMQELNDKKTKCIEEEDFDQAKTIKIELDKLKKELELLRDRRLGLAGDVSRMSIDGGGDKLSSTVLDNNNLLDESRMSDCNQEEVRIFKMHTNELLRCLQMYFACLQNVKINNIPQIMLNHLKLLSFEALDEWFNNNSRVRSLMIACNGLTALYDKNFAQDPINITLLLSACRDKSSIEVRTIAIQSVIDIICQHPDIEVPIDDVEKYLDYMLKDYGKYDPDSGKKSEFNFLSAIVKGAAKLYYYRKLSDPTVLSHLIIWWYHPRTHSKLRQFIGIYLPTLVENLTKLHLLKKKKEGGDDGDDDTWLIDLFRETFITSVEFLHDYILNRGFDIMSASDIHNLINFLCNLIPVQFHEEILKRVEKEMDDLPSSQQEDLLKYLKHSKNCLSASAAVSAVQN